MSIVKFPYIQYVTIVYVISPLGCCIKADTTILVGALFILGDRVKCIPIYLVSFQINTVKDAPLDNKYSSSQTVLSPLRHASNQLLKDLMCSHVIQSSHRFGCLKHRLFLCSSTYGVTRVELCRIV